MLIKKVVEVTIDEVIETLSRGGLVIMPTETLYGAMVDATNQTAVNKLTLYKNRPFGKPYSVACANMLMADYYVEINDVAKNLYKTYLPGPLTIVSRGKHKLAIGVESELGTLGIRVPKYKLVLDVVRKYRKPITATSANASYKKRPYKILDILDNLSEKQKGYIDLIVDAGELPHNDPSTVIDTTLDDPVILRQGLIKLKDKNEVLSRNIEDTQNVAKELWQKYEQFLGTRAVVFALEGPMGAGKTIFTKGLGLAMQIKDEVISPTYSLEEEYKLETQNSNVKNQNIFVHIDAWRMVEEKELEEIGFGQRIKNKNVIALEWADRVVNVVREYDEEAVIIWVKIAYGKNDNERLIGWGAL
jgi:L-threonylcarbamoyladenylate synthase